MQLALSLSGAPPRHGQDVLLFGRNVERWSGTRGIVGPFVYFNGQNAKDFQQVAFVCARRERRPYAQQVSRAQPRLSVVAAPFRTSAYPMTVGVASVGGTRCHCVVGEQTRPIAIVQLQVALFTIRLWCSRCAVRDPRLTTHRRV